MLSRGKFPIGQTTATDPCKHDDVKAYIRTARDEDKLETIETWDRRRLLKVSWRDKITNESYLRIVEQCYSRYTQGTRLKWLGHVLRHPGTLADVIQEKV